MRALIACLIASLSTAPLSAPGADQAASPAGGDHVPDFVVRRCAGLLVDGLFLPPTVHVSQLGDRLTAVILEKLRKDPSLDWGAAQALKRIAPYLSSLGKDAALATYEEIAGPSGIVTRRNDACAPLFLEWYETLSADPAPFHRRRISELLKSARSKSPQASANAWGQVMSLPPDDAVPVFRSLIETGDARLADRCWGELRRLQKVDKSTLKSLAAGTLGATARSARAYLEKWDHETDADWLVRRALHGSARDISDALSALDLARDFDSVAALIPRLPDGWQERAMTDLAFMDGARAAPVLEGFAASDRVSLRLSAYHALSFSWMRDVTQLAERAMRSSDPRERAMAPMMVNRVFGWKDGGVIARCAHDPSPYVRKETARELGFVFSHQEDAVPLLGKLLGDQDRDVRRAAVAALYELSASSQEVGHPVWPNMPVPPEITNMRRALEPVTASRAFRAELSDGDRTTREKLHYLADMEFQNCILWVDAVNAFRTDKWRRAYTLAWSLLKSKDARALAAAPAEAAACAGLLAGRLGDILPGAQDACGRSSNYAAREGLIIGIDQLYQFSRDAEQFDYLAPYVHDPDVRVRDDVMFVLGQGGKRGLGYLRQMVSDPDPDIRRLAAAQCILEYYGIQGDVAVIGVVAR